MSKIVFEELPPRGAGPGRPKLTEGGRIRRRLAERPGEWGRVGNFAPSQKAEADKLSRQLRSAGVKTVQRTVQGRLRVYGMVESASDE